MRIFNGTDNFFETIISYIQNNKSVKEILFYGFLDKELLKRLNEHFSFQNESISYKFIIPKIQYCKTGLIYINQTKMESKCEVRVNPKCNAQFIIIDNLFCIISGLKNKEEGIGVNNVVIICYEDKEALDILKEIFNEGWKSSYSITL